MSSELSPLLFLVPWLELGGADKFNLDLVTLLSQREYRVTICTTAPSDNRWSHLFEAVAEKIIVLPRTVPLEEQPQTILDLIEAEQFKVVLISNSYLGYLLLPLIRAYFPELTIVDYNHMEELRWQHGGYPRLAVEYQELLDLNIVSSQHLKHWLIEQGGQAEQIEVCYTNIDPISWDPTRIDRASLCRDLKLAENRPLILYAGRIVNQKRPQLFAEVIRRLAQVEKLDFVCLVAGEGENLPALKGLVRHHQLDPQVHFLGAVPLEQMKGLHSIADIFFLPSQNEGLSLALFETMAMETVSVAADVGGQRELVAADCGYPRSY